MWSGCKDSQTSADADEAGKATGAMSYAFITALSACHVSLLHLHFSYYNYDVDDRCKPTTELHAAAEFHS